MYQYQERDGEEERKPGEKTCVIDLRKWWAKSEGNNGPMSMTNRQWNAIVP